MTGGRPFIYVVEKRLHGDGASPRGRSTTNSPKGLSSWWTRCVRPSRQMMSRNSVESLRKRWKVEDSFIAYYQSDDFNQILFCRT